MNSKLLFVILFSVILSACGKSVVGTYTDASGMGSFDFRSNGTVLQSPMGLEFPYEVSGKEIKVKMPMGTMVFTMQDDGSLSSQLLGTLRRKGDTSSAGKSAGDGAKSSMSFSEFRKLTHQDLHEDWKKADQEIHSQLHDKANICRLESEIAGSIGGGLIGSSPDNAAHVLGKTIVSKILSITLQQPRIGEAAKNLKVSKESFMDQFFADPKMVQPSIKEIDQAKRYVLRLSMSKSDSAGMSAAVLKACLDNGPVIQ